MNTPLLLTIRQFCEQNQGFKESGIRSLIFCAEENGLGQCFVRVGRKILIIVDALFLWLDEKNGGNKLNLVNNAPQNREGRHD